MWRNTYYYVKIMSYIYIFFIYIKNSHLIVIVLFGSLFWTCAVPRIAALLSSGAQRRIRPEQITDCLSPNTNTHTHTHTQTGRVVATRRRTPREPSITQRCSSGLVVGDLLQSCATRRSWPRPLAPATAAGRPALS